MEKYEFAGPEWVAAIGRILEEGLAGEDLSGIDYGACEEFTDAPEHLCNLANGSVAWYFRIGDGTFEVGSGLLDNPAMKVVADYQTILPIARAVFAENPELAGLAKEAMEAGKLRIEGDPTGGPAVLAKLNLHDAVARHTA